MPRWWDKKELLALKERVPFVFDGTQGKPRVPHRGTFNANPMSKSAGLKAMELMDRAEFARINELGDLLRAAVTRVFADERFPAKITGRGSLARIRVKTTSLVDSRSSYRPIQSAV